MLRSAITAFLFVFMARMAGAEDRVEAIPVLPVPVSSVFAHPIPATDAPRPVRQTSAQKPVSPLVTVLRQKQAELDQLQQEVRKLRAETGAPQQIVVRVKLVEVSLNKLEKLGLDVSSGDSGRVNVNNVSELARAAKILSGGGFAQLPANGESDGAQRLIKVLLQNNVAKVVSEPTVVAMDGQPATIHVGGEIPYPPGIKAAAENRPTGSQVDVVPMTLGENRVRLDLNLRVCNVDYTQTQEMYGISVPRINTSGCSTQIESEFGQSTILSGLMEVRKECVKRGDKIEEVENRIALVFVITPELSDSPVASQRRSVQATAK